MLARGDFQGSRRVPVKFLIDEDFGSVGIRADDNRANTIRNNGRRNARRLFVCGFFCSGHFLGRRAALLAGGGEIGIKEPLKRRRNSVRTQYHERSSGSAFALMPTTSPLKLSSGPPLLPGLIGASVCTHVPGPAFENLPSALTMPLVT